MWSEMTPSSQANLIKTLVVLAISVLAVLVLITQAPGRWSSAVGIGCSIAAIGFSSLALRVRENRKSDN